MKKVDKGPLFPSSAMVGSVISNLNSQKKKKNLNSQEQVASGEERSTCAQNGATSRKPLEPCFIIKADDEGEAFS